jgi:hypothetical protein
MALWDANPHRGGGQLRYFVSVAGQFPEPSGLDALVEVNLLVRAIVGGIGQGSLDQHMAYNAARNAASIPKGRAVHTVYVRDGQVIGDSWQHVSVHGAGRSNASVDEAARRDAVELRVDITERIAIDRLRVLIDALESLVPASDAAMFRNALAVAQRNPGAPDTALTAVAAQIDAILRSAASQTRCTKSVYRIAQPR